MFKCRLKGVQKHLCRMIRFKVRVIDISWWKSDKLYSLKVARYNWKVRFIIWYKDFKPSNKWNRITNQNLEKRIRRDSIWFAACVDKKGKRYHINSMKLCQWSALMILKNKLTRKTLEITCPEFRKRFAKETQEFLKAIAKLN